MAKLFKLTAYVVDYNDEFSQRELIDILEYGPYDIHLRQMEVDGADLGEWDDDHPLNYIDCPEAEYEKYFKENNYDG